MENAPKVFLPGAHTKFTLLMGPSFMEYLKKPQLNYHQKWLILTTKQDDLFSHPRNLQSSIPSQKEAREMPAAPGLMPISNRNIPISRNPWLKSDISSSTRTTTDIIKVIPMSKSRSHRKRQHNWKRLPLSNCNRLLN